MRGKTMQTAGEDYTQGVASMRPPQNAGENAQRETLRDAGNRLQ